MASEAFLPPSLLSTTRHIQIAGYRKEANLPGRNSSNVLSVFFTPMLPYSGLPRVNSIYMLPLDRTSKFAFAQSVEKAS